MTTTSNHILKRAGNHSIILDYYVPSGNKKPIIIFAHGYKGFKDWGAWTMMGKALSNAGYCFVKFNFSHNGGTMSDPIDFPNLESFANNNYSKEVKDLNDMIFWAQNNLSDVALTDKIYLIGHSRAGGIASIVASQNKAVKKLITLASVSDYGTRFPQGSQLTQWKEKGVFYVKNGRTRQDMPHYYQFYEDYINNKHALSIKKAVESLTIPHLIIHGIDDKSVSVEEAIQINKWNPRSQIYLIRAGNHTLGATHPWNETILPKHLRKAVQCCTNFLNKHH